MKRLIAVSVVLALLASAAFAEVTVTGQVIGHVDVVGGGDDYKDSDDKSLIMAGGNLDRVRIGLEAESDDGKFGAWARFNSGGYELKLSGDFFENLEDPDVDFSDLVGRSLDIYGFAWWKPIDQFQLYIGQNPDCFFAKEGITGWAFYGDAADAAVASHLGFKFVSPGAFYGGFDAFGAAMSISPLDLLSLNIAIPYPLGWEEAEKVYENINVQADLNLGAMNIALTYAGSQNLYAYFGMGGDSALSLDVGFRFNFDMDEEPMAFGAGVGYDISDAFGIQFRGMASFGGGDDDFTEIDVDLLPYFAVTGDLKAYVGLGLSTTLYDGDAHKDKEVPLSFYINPYVVVGDFFFAGFKLESNFNGTWDKDNKAESTVSWKIPVGINFAF